MGRNNTALIEQINLFGTTWEFPIRAFRGCTPTILLFGRLFCCYLDDRVYEVPRD